MSSSLTSSQLSPLEGYRLWADTYDHERNALLSLEQRVLESLLPPLRGLDVVDLGCGTGRLLNISRIAGARSLVGVDISREMLDVARAKLGDDATLICAGCTNAPIGAASADVVFCNFVLSYLEEPEALLSLVKTMLRPGGSFFLTDVHPDTAAALAWRRGVSVRGEFKEIRTHSRSLNNIVALIKREDLDLSIRLELAFGEEERAIFEENGKIEYFNRMRERPAIYLLQATSQEKAKGYVFRQNEPGTLNHLRAGRCALGASDSAALEMRISVGRIDAMVSDDKPGPLHASGGCLDLRGYLVLPGLINAHDHLEFALFPRMGKGGYSNFLEWAEDIHRSQAAEIARHRQIPKKVRLWWGGIRNVLCGVTTVCHHNPFESEVFSNDFIVRVLREYGWAHSLSLEPTAALKKRLTAEGHPFFIHLGEGIDEQSGREIFDLWQAGGLDDQTVVIHGLGLEAKGRALLASAGAGLVWCPSSNLFLFGKSMGAKELRELPKVALGSDSSLTADGDLLDEIRCAHEVLHASGSEIYGYVTRQAAALLHLKNGEGAFRAGGVADLIAVRDGGRAPAQTLSALSYREVELVLIGGRVQLVSQELKQRLPSEACEGLQPLSVEGVVRWIRAPLDQLFEETTAHLRGQIFLGGKQVCLGN